MKKAETTRLTILQNAFDLIYAKGYQATSIDDILATTKVTKGAFYYHFRNKDEMGLAIINDLMKPAFNNGFTGLQKAEDSLTAIYNLMHHLLMENDFLKVEYGCPVANFSQEMTPWNKEFSDALNEITALWTKMLTAAIERGKNKGFIRKEVNAKQATVFIMSGYWGVRNLGKLANNKRAYLPYLKELKNYLDSLK